MTTSHTLYRFFDAEGRLLYVGRTINPGRRWREHERHADWFADVATATRVAYPDADDLADAEIAAIQTERPLHNVAHAVREKRARAESVAEPVTKLLYTLDDLAETAGQDRGVVEDLVRVGEIESVTIGRRRLVPAEALTDYVERLRAAS